MKKEIVIPNHELMVLLGENIGKLLEANMVIALSGDLGAGKTTLTKGIGRGLKIDEIINSPTFTILKIYQGRLTLYHMDVYRIDRNSGDDDLEEFFELNGVCVVEWADNIRHILPDEILNIEIKVMNDNQRLVLISSDSSKYISIIESVNV